MFGLKHNCKKIIAVGRNFADHAKELGNEIGSKPVIFLKPTSSIIEKGADELHHEVELGIVVGKRMRKSKPNDIMSSVHGYVMALDLTDRKLQNELKSKQLPWCLAKGFDTACPLGPLLPLDALPSQFLSASRQDFNSVTSEIWLNVNKMERQRSCLNLMLWSPAELITFIAQYITLEPGDIILTGTPSGVGPIRSGDQILFGLNDKCDVEYCVK